jgi:septum formation protein
VIFCENNDKMKSSTWQESVEVWRIRWYVYSYQFIFVGGILRLTQLILASSSPRRKELLEQLSLSFIVQTSSVDESQIAHTEPEQLVMELALLKARSVAATSFSSALIIGADTVVALDGDILGKPRNRANAVAMLERLSGRKHQVFSGVSVVEQRNGDIIQMVTDYRCTDVWMRPLTATEINWYVDTGEPMDKAGSYGIQGLGACLVERITGCYFNVVGLSLSLLIQLFQQLGYHLVTDFAKQKGC